MNLFVAMLLGWGVQQSYRLWVLFPDKLSMWKNNLCFVFLLVQPGSVDKLQRSALVIGFNHVFLLPHPFSLMARSQCTGVSHRHTQGMPHFLPLAQFCHFMMWYPLWLHNWSDHSKVGQWSIPCYGSWMEVQGTHFPTGLYLSVFITGSGLFLQIPHFHHGTAHEAGGQCTLVCHACLNLKQEGMNQQ